MFTILRFQKIKKFGSDSKDELVIYAFATTRASGTTAKALTTLI